MRAPGASKGRRLRSPELEHDAVRPVLRTARLALRHLDTGDAPFILRLLNEPSWLQHIGDRGVRTLVDAEQYIASGPREMYRRRGFGLYQVRLVSSDQPIGMCGLLKRDALEDVDLGFAFFPEFWGHGYAREAAAAVMAEGRDVYGLARIVAIVSPANGASRRLLEKLGFGLERAVRLEAGAEELLLYGAAT